MFQGHAVHVSQPPSRRSAIATSSISWGPTRLKLTPPSSSTTGKFNNVQSGRPACQFQSTERRERRDLPWELVEKEYAFEGDSGKQTLDDTFKGRSQLVIYHATFNPETVGPSTTWTKDAPCFSCSFWMDNFNGITGHLNHRDITTAASFAPPSRHSTCSAPRPGGELAHAAGAADRPPDGRGHVQQGNLVAAVHEPTHCRVPSVPGLPEAGDRIARRSAGPAPRPGFQLPPEDQGS